MRKFAMLALLLHVGAAAVYAQEATVKLTFSGTSGPSTITLPQPNTSTDGDNFAGQGTLGSFTVTIARAIANNPGTSATCVGANLLFLPELAGAGVFRFQDGSLLEIALTQGGDCIDLSTNVAHCTLNFQITGGTGRFQHASGVLTMTETVKSVAIDTNGDPVVDINGNPIFFAATGEFTGTVSGVQADEGNAQASGNRENRVRELPRALPSATGVSGKFGGVLR